MVVLASAALLPVSVAAQASSRAAAAFGSYVARAEERVRHEEANPRTFLYIPADGGPDAASLGVRLRNRDVLVEECGDTPTAVPGGLIHDWVGVIFIPHAAMGRVLDVLQDYNNSAIYFQPEVLTSHLLARRGDEFQVVMRLREHKAITVVLDAEFDVHY